MCIRDSPCSGPSPCRAVQAIRSYSMRNRSRCSQLGLRGARTLRPPDLPRGRSLFRVETKAPCS
eukprot:15161114-Alexandrium_andersonii.AAC.1